MTTTPATNETPTADVRIVVLPRGWVAIGDYAETATEVVLTNAWIIRRWGTSKGLGELVSGPTKSTVLDPAGELRANLGSILFTIKADAAAWADR
jgi:hypothetical protein